MVRTSISDRNVPSKQKQKTQNRNIIFSPIKMFEVARGLISECSGENFFWQNSRLLCLERKNAASGGGGRSRKTKDRNMNMN